MPKSKRRFFKIHKSEFSETENSKTLKLRIEKIIPGGWGLGFAENLTIFTALAAVGDELIVRIRERKGKIAFAEIVEILNPSADRIKPPCKYFGSCGGCDFQQMNYHAQLEAKKNIILDSLKRIGKINYQNEIKIIGSPRDFGYRARAQWHVDSRKKRIGYFKRYSKEIIDVEECPILIDELQSKLTEFRKNINWEDFWSEIVEIETASAGNLVSIYSSELIEPTDELSFQIKNHKYAYDAQTFFQGNPFLIEKLIESAIENSKGEIALDLFCGVGLFTLPLAEKFAKVYAVEASEKSSAFLHKNLEKSLQKNIEIFSSTTNDWFSEKIISQADFVLLDPPRAGAEPETLKNIINLKPKEISYVSCDPATLARDLRIFLDADYKLDSLTAIDLFPQTHHIETIARLSKS